MSAGFNQAVSSVILTVDGKYARGGVVYDQSV